VRLWRTAGFSARPAAIHCLRVSCWRADRVVRRVIPPVCRWHAAPRQHGQHQRHAGYRQAPPQFASGSCRTASNSTLTSQRWPFSAPLLSSGQLPTSPPSKLPEALCRSHRSSSRLAWPLIPTCGSTVTRGTLQRPATATLVLCATCAVYWLTTSPRQSRAASSLPGSTTAMHCWVAHRRRLSISYSATRTSWPESSARAKGRTDARPLLHSLHWLPVRQQVTCKLAVLTHKVRTTATPTYLSELVQTRAPPLIALFRCSDARRSSHTHRTGPSRFFCCCSIHLELFTCWHSTVRKHSHFQMPLENPSIQTHLVLLCCIKRLCIFGPKGAIQIRYYYYYYYDHRHLFTTLHNLWRFTASLHFSVTVYCYKRRRTLGVMNLFHSQNLLMTLHCHQSQT